MTLASDDVEPPENASWSMVHVSVTLVSVITSLDERDALVDVPCACRVVVTCWCGMPCPPITLHMREPS